MQSKKLSMALSVGTILIAGTTLAACNHSPFEAKNGDASMHSKMANGGSCGAKKDGSCGANKSASCGAKKDSSYSANKEGACGANK